MIKIEIINLRESMFQTVCVYLRITFDLGNKSDKKKIMLNVIKKTATKRELKCL